MTPSKNNERGRAQEEMVVSIEAHRETGKAMREAASNVGFQLGREDVLRRVRDHLETMGPTSDMGHTQSIYTKDIKLDEPRAFLDGFYHCRKLVISLLTSLKKNDHE